MATQFSECTDHFGGDHWKGILRVYTGDYLYAPLNEALRKAHLGGFRWENITCLLVMALEKMPLVRGTLYAGFKQPVFAHRAGDRCEIAQFRSTSPSEEAARNFLRGERLVQFQVVDL